MYPTRLNLLSAEKKKNLDKLINAQFIKSILELFLVVICFSAVFILISQNIMEIYYRSINNNVPLVNSFYNDTNDKIRHINAILKDASDIQTEYFTWTPLIADLSASVPPGVHLSTFNLNKASGQFVFSGSAKTREALLAWQKNIEKINCANSCRLLMTIPASQLTKKDNINFSLTASFSVL